MTTLWNPSPTASSVFLAPNVVIGGNEAASTVGTVLTDRLGLAGGGAVLLAVDDAVSAAGLVEPIAASLRDSGFRVEQRGGFGAEPSAEVLDPIIAEARAAGVDAVVGVGGGSVLDSSKLIALMLKNDGTCSDWLGEAKPSNGVAPMVLIPTTCGTGSETTRVAMVTIAGEKRASVCDLYIPAVAIIDPTLVASLPKSVIAATGMDALAHAVEAMMATTASMLSVTHSLRAIELLVENLETAANGDKEALAKVMWASHIAGQALNAGVVFGHSLAYSLAHAQPMPHGMSCALALPYCIAYNQNLDSKLGERIARAITAGKSESLRVAADEVAALVSRLGLPATLPEARIAETDIAEIASMCVGSYPRPTNPEPLDEAKIAALLEAMNTGDIEQAFAVTA